MEDFWQNIKDTLVLIFKVAIIAMALDVVFKIQEMEMRIPFLSRIVDWVFFQFG